MDAFWFFAGVAAYYKLDEVRLAREADKRARYDERACAIDQLRSRAESLQDEFDEMQFDLTCDPDKYSARQMRAAQQRADRAQEALLLAQAANG